MYQIAQNFKLHLVLSFTICASLLLLPGVSLLSEASQGQGQSAATNAGPRHKQPEGILPDLEDIKRESGTERIAPGPIHSTQRSPTLSEKPWNGRRVGDPETMQRQLDQAVVVNQKIRRAHAHRSAPFTMYED